MPEQRAYEVAVVTNFSIAIMNKQAGNHTIVKCRWADQFANLNLQEGIPNGDQLAAEFLNQPVSQPEPCFSGTIASN